MISRSNANLLSLCKSISEKSGLAVLTVGCPVFIGWIFKGQFLNSLHPNLSAMKVNWFVDAVKQLGHYWLALNEFPPMEIKIR